MLGCNPCLKRAIAPGSNQAYALQAHNEVNVMKCIGLPIVLVLGMSMQLGAKGDAPPLPAITYLSDPTPPDTLCVLVGDGWDKEKPEIVITPVPDGDPGLPSSTFSADGQEGLPAKVVSHASPQTLTWLLPAGKFGVWAVQAKGPNGISKPFLMNQACPDWLSTDSANPGQVVRAIGRGLVGLEKYAPGAEGQPVSYGGYVEQSGVRAVLKDADGRFFPTEIVKASSYDTHFRIAAELAPGNYEVYLHNGHGGKYGWSMPLALKIVAPDPWPTKEFDVKDYGAKGDNATDNAPAVQKALDSAGRNGGGVVLFPPGNYRFLDTIKVPRRTVLRGVDRGRVWLLLPTGAREGWGTPQQGMKIEAFIQGDIEFGVENLNIHGVYSRSLIKAPINPGRVKNVFIRNCHIVHEPTFDYHTRPKDDPILSNLKLTEERDETILGGMTAVCLYGDHCEITYCDIKGGGTAVYLLGSSRYSRIANNTLRLGSMNAAVDFHQEPSPSEKDIIEDNVFTVATNVNHSALRCYARGNRGYLARNRIEPLFWVCDCEALLWESYGASTTVHPSKVAGTMLDITPRSEQDVAENNWFANWDCLVILGRGLGQYRKILSNKGNTLELDKPWSIEPDSKSLVALQNQGFYQWRIIDNSVADAGPGIFFYGAGFEAIIDGNRAVRNNGVCLLDFSRAALSAETRWQFAGCYMNQILHNVVSDGRRMGGMIGATGGTHAHGLVTMVVRDNVTEQDTVLTASPSTPAKYGLNYVGVVFENNLSRNNEVGIRLGKGVEATLRRNRFVNVDVPVEDADAQQSRTVAD